MNDYIVQKARKKSTVAMRNIVEAHLEVSSDCNLRCKYCYATGNDRARNLMSLDVAFDFVETVLCSSCSKEIHIVLHGGEPLLQSANWLRNVLAYGYRLARLLGKTVRFEMQSNLTLLDDSKLEVIKDYKVIVGTSLDGIPSCNDRVRGNGENVIPSIKRLQEAGCFGGVICVVGQENCQNIPEVLSYFQGLGIMSCDLLIRYSVGAGNRLPPLTVEDIKAALIGSFSYLSSTRGKAAVDRNVTSKLNRFLNPPTADDFHDILICGHPICGAGLTTCLCDSEGNLFPCGCSVCSSDNVLGVLGQLSGEGFIGKVTEFHSKHLAAQRKCSDCAAITICRCGCAAFGPIDTQTAAAECQAVKEFYDMLHQQPMDLLIEIVSNIEANRPWE